MTRTVHQDAVELSDRTPSMRLDSGGSRTSSSSDERPPSPAKRLRPTDSPTRTKASSGGLVRRPKASMGKTVAADTYHAEGDAKCRQGHFQEAIDLYSKAINLVPGNVRALCDRSLAFLKAGRADEALQDAQQAQQADPHSVLAAERRARALLLLCRFPESIVAYKEAVGRWGASHEALRTGLTAAENAQRLITQCQEEVQGQRPQSALAVLDRLVAAVPDLAHQLPVLRTRTEIWNQVGLQCHNRQLYEEACDAYTTAITTADGEGLADLRKTVYCNRAASHKQQGNLKAALEDCARSIQLDAAFAVPYVRLARILEQLQQLDAAVRWLTGVPAAAVEEELRRLERLRSHQPSGDYYGLLGLDEGCDAVALKAAYKRLALLWHPDKCAPEAQDLCDCVFKAIAHAHSILGNEESRAAYHRQRDALRKEPPPRPAADNPPAPAPAPGSPTGRGRRTAPREPLHPPATATAATVSAAEGRKTRSQSRRAAPTRVRGRGEDRPLEDPVPPPPAAPHGPPPPSARSFWHAGPSGPSAGEGRLRDLSPGLSPRLGVPLRSASPFPRPRDPTPMAMPMSMPMGMTPSLRDASPMWTMRDPSPMRTCSTRDPSPFRGRPSLAATPSSGGWPPRSTSRPRGPSPWPFPSAVPGR